MIYEMSSLLDDDLLITSDDDTSTCSSYSPSETSTSSSSSYSSSSSTGRPRKKRLTKRAKKKSGSEEDEACVEELNRTLELLMTKEDGDTSSDDEDVIKAPLSSSRRQGQPQTTVLISSSSTSDEEDMDSCKMRSISDDEAGADEEDDSDFDPDDMLKMEDHSDTASVVSTASSTATWSSILSAGPARKKRRLDANGKYVRVSQTALSINALKDEFSISLGSTPSSLTFEALSTRSSEIAASILERASKPQKNNGFKRRPNISDMPPPAALKSRRVTNASYSKLSKGRYGYKPHIPPNIEFANEIKTVITTYLSLVFLQRAMNNTNNNSSGYYGDMVDKMIDMINNIPREEMTHEKYQSTVRDALYMYCIVVSKLTGPEHLKRLRTPKLHSCFCYLIAMMVNNLPIDSDLTLASKSTNLVQFASGMSDPAYRTAIHNLSNVFNNSYSVVKALNLPTRYFIMVNQILAILSTKNTPLFERKPRTLAQSAYLYFDHRLRDPLISSGLPREQNSLGAAVRLVAKQLACSWINWDSLEDGFSMTEGKFESEGVTLRSLGGGQKDIKIVGISTVLTEMFRREFSTVALS